MNKIKFRVQKRQFSRESRILRRTRKREWGKHDWATERVALKALVGALDMLFEKAEIFDKPESAAESEDELKVAQPLSPYEHASPA